jgi:hypothetical protein
MKRPDFREVIHRTGVMRALAEFDPHLAGTLPLGLDLSTSDLDVLCHAPKPDLFAIALWVAFGNEANFSLRQRIDADRPVIASFTVHGWLFQVFGQVKPVVEQAGWRHFLVERRLLKLGGPPFRAAVMRERSLGMKTEPAFAAALRLKNDPCLALLDLERHDDAALSDLLGRVGFEVRPSSPTIGA